MLHRLSEVNTITFDLELNVDKANAELRKIQGILQGYLGLLHRLGLPEEIDAIITNLQHLIQIVNAARRALIALQALRMAAGDPIAWAQFGLMAGTFAVDISEQAARRP